MIGQHDAASEGVLAGAAPRICAAEALSFGLSRIRPSQDRASPALLSRTGPLLRY